MEEICTSWAAETQDKIGMLSKEKNRLEQEARVKGVELWSPPGDVRGGGGGGTGQETRIVRQLRGVFFCWVNFALGAELPAGLFLPQAL